MAVVFVIFLTVVIAKFVVPRFEATYAERTAAIQGGMEKAEKAQEEAEAALKQYRRSWPRPVPRRPRSARTPRPRAPRSSPRCASRPRPRRPGSEASAEAQLEAERTQVMTQLRSEIGGLATTLAGRIVGESLDDDERARRTVDRFLADLESDEPAETAERS